MPRASLRAGLTVAGIVKPYLNLRYRGGGASGTSSDKVGFGDGYSSNWLHTLAITAGAEVVLGLMDTRRAISVVPVPRKAMRMIRAHDERMRRSLPPDQGLELTIKSKTRRRPDRL